jgi:hypothetical protein
MQDHGLLFGTEYLAEYIQAFPEWKELTDERVEEYRRRLTDIFDRFPTDGKPNEAVTEAELVEKVLEVLGWHFLRQLPLSPKGRTEVPDFALYPDPESKKAQNYQTVTAFLEAKAWNRHLDRQTEGQKHDLIPSNQVLRYLSVADTATAGKLQWGILTNGRYWRAYYTRARSRSEEYFEIDLLDLVRPQADTPPLDMFAEAHYGTLDRYRAHFFKLFLFFFGAEAYAQSGDGRMDHAVAGARYWEEQVAAALRTTVFNEVYPLTLEALYFADPDRPQHLDPEYREQLRVNGLYLLYRLLFICYAEDRDLLPVSHKDYRAISLQEEIRKPIAGYLDQQVAFGQDRVKYYPLIDFISKVIDKGDRAAGIPPYNGGLFNPKNAPLLHRVQLSDHYLAGIIDKISRRKGEDDRPRWINYRDMSVQQLGSIYEGLLEFEPVLENSQVLLRPNAFARKVSGSYYTPQSVVSLLLEKSIDTFADQFRKEFDQKVAFVMEHNFDLAERNRRLREADPAARLLELRVLDPAMGSGHFLVSVVDLLADRALELINETPARVPWQKEAAYVSPVTVQASDIKARILQLAKDNGYYVPERRLELRQLVRRIALKRCVYGVDKNSMAVELAKVALWLHTFTTGAPLSFLDHHIRHGDSLFGKWVGKTLMELGSKSGGLLFIQNEIANARASVQAMQKIEELTDSDIDEVHQSAAEYSVVQQLTGPLLAFLSLYHAFEWVAGKDKEKKTVFSNYRLGAYGNPLAIAQGTLEPQNATPRALAIFEEARQIAREEAFVHWQVTFPGIWQNWTHETPIGGFDLVVGNPPWDFMKIQELEWFASRDRSISLLTGANRKKKIAALETENPALFKEFKAAYEHAMTRMMLARESGEYPLLSSGDINYYSLFVERAHALAKPEGLVGLVCPSGIAADKTAAPYFRSITTAGRLLYFYDFENKKLLFPDVHASFKFCVLVAQNEGRPPAAAAELCFFIIPKKFENTHWKLKEKKQLENFKNQIAERSFRMTAADFRAVNPNTGTAPIFRTQRDAEITLRIYRRFPILHEHDKGKVWPVKYLRMFDMTNDSHLFKRKDELEKEGFYPIRPNWYKKGPDKYVPLYEGKMVQMFNHRAAEIVYNEENLKRPAQQVEVPTNKLRNVDFFATPQFYIPEKQVSPPFPYYIALKNVSAPTNIRTMIAGIIPFAGAGHSLPLLLVESETKPQTTAYFLSILCSFLFDYILRQKVQGQNLSWYIIEQMPVIPPAEYDRVLSGDYIEKPITVGQYVIEQVLPLTYTAWDLKPFADDLGYAGDPFVWDETDRAHRMARLDALYFLLYGCTEDEIAYIMDQFPIVKEKDEQTHAGEYRTRDLILQYFRALKAGDTEY